MLVVLKNLRLKWGWKFIEPYVKEALTEKKGVFAGFFKVEKVTFKNNDGEDFESPLVFCSDVVGFVETLAHLRGYNFTDMVEKVGMDSGKGHLRMVLTLYDEEDLLHLSTGSRVTRQEGIGSGCQYKLTGRKKIMILATTPKVPESYLNCSIIMNSDFSLFLDCLVGLRDTINSTFGFILDPYYQGVISRFHKSFKDLRSRFNVSETTKLHIIFTHVAQFIELTGKPLGEFSEQELENSHSAFESIWNRYRVKKTSSEVYSANYFRAVLGFNAQNI